MKYALSLSTAESSLRDTIGGKKWEIYGRILLDILQKFNTFRLVMCIRFNIPVKMESMMKKMYHNGFVIIIASAFIFCWSRTHINAEPGVKVRNPKAQSQREPNRRVSGLHPSENKKQFDSGKVPVKSTDVITMNSSCFHKIRSFGLRDIKKFRGLNLHVRKDIDYKILSMHVREDIDYKILGTR